MPKLHFHYSTMNAGKSTLLLQAAHNCRQPGIAVLLLAARLDHRAGEGRIASRIGIAEPAETFGPATDPHPSPPSPPRRRRRPSS